MSDEHRKATERTASLGQTVRAVLWGMFGVRRGSEYHRDSSSLNPVHLIIAAFIAVFLLVVLLIFVARWAAG